MNRKLLATAAAFLLFNAMSGCGPIRTEDLTCSAGLASEPAVASEAFAGGYFPESYSEPTVSICGLPLQPRISEHESEWFGGQWRAACEPSIWAVSEATERPDFLLRFSALPSFSPSVFITVESEGENHTLTVKQMSGAGGYDAGSISRSKDVSLTTEEVAEIRRILADGDLFEQTGQGPVSESSEGSCFFGFDGTTWIFETADENGYSMAQYWSPDGGASRTLGDYLIELSGWEFDGI
jgi:hypothetical protein